MPGNRVRWTSLSDLRSNTLSQVRVKVIGPNGYEINYFTHTIDQITTVLGKVSKITDLMEKKIMC